MFLYFFSLLVPMLAVLCSTDILTARQHFNLSSPEMFQNIFL